MKLKNTGISKDELVRKEIVLIEVYRDVLREMAEALFHPSISKHDTWIGDLKKKILKLQGKHLLIQICQNYLERYQKTFSEDTLKKNWSSIN
ncbi:MAG: hypothetical protein HWD61_11965 [Parachlamydiaceae bacterium]|nr:MAG: hypothetical protein HWD61_11965 [Parachlamydiaceae bacterium]